MKITEEYTRQEKFSNKYLAIFLKKKNLLN